MEEIIAKSKAAKRLKAKEREEDDDKLEALDDAFKSLSKARAPLGWPLAAFAAFAAPAATLGPFHFFGRCLCRLRGLLMPVLWLLWRSDGGVGFRLGRFRVRFGRARAISSATPARAGGTGATTATTATTSSTALCASCHHLTVGAFLRRSCRAYPFQLPCPYSAYTLLRTLHAAPDTGIAWECLSCAL